MKNIKIKLKQTFVYDMYKKTLQKYIQNIRIQNEKKELQNNGLKYVNLISERLKEENIECFLNYGTLLGIIRDKKFMDYDYDIDFGLVVNDKFDWKYFETILLDLGGTKVRQFKFNNLITEQSYRFGKIFVDFFIHQDEKDYSCEYAYCREENITYASDKQYSVNKQRLYKFKFIEEIHINQYKLFIPNEAEKYLASVYGENWRIPDSNWKDQDSPAYNILPDEYGECEYFI